MIQPADQLLIAALFCHIDAHLAILPKCSMAQTKDRPEREQQHSGVVLSFLCLRMFVPLLLPGAVELRELFCEDRAKLQGRPPVLPGDSKVDV
jgi:hypothetical protein